MKKKLFLIALTALSMSISAQNFSLTYPGGSIPNGGSIIFSTDEDTPITSGQRPIYVHNNGATDALVKCKKTIIDTIPGTQNMFCWGQCFGPATEVSPNPLIIMAGDSTDEGGFSGEYYPYGNSGDSHIKYTFFSDTDSISVIVTYHVEPLSNQNYSKIDEYLDVFPNPASAMITIGMHYSPNTNKTITMKNILGAIVYPEVKPYTNDKITINTTDLIDGIYFLTITSNGLVVNTKKIIIKHWRF